MSFDLPSLWDDLRRRRVFQVAAVFAAGAWVIVQIADVVGPAVGMPQWVMTALVGCAIVGFPIAVILAWLFDVTPEGVRRTQPGSATGLFAICTSLALLVAGSAGFVWLIKPAAQSLELASDFEPIENSVAVMPFADLSPDRSLEHFAFGIADVLIHRLSPIAQLTIFSSDSTSNLNEPGRDDRTAARMLRAQRMLTGSVQRADGRYRISTRLIDTNTGRSLWAEQFDRAEEDIFEIQDEIALAVAREMNAVLDADVRQRVTGPLASDLDAYDLYLLAINKINNTPLDDGNAEGIELLEQAVAKDPTFALGWAILSSTVFWHAGRGLMPFEEGVNKSRQYLEKALKLDPELSEAHSQAMMFAGLHEGDFNAARRSFDRAIEYGPSNALAYNGFGMILQRNGRYEESLEVLSKGLLLNPYSATPFLRYNLGYAKIVLGDYDEGMRHIVASYQLNKGTALENQDMLVIGGASGDAGHYDEAVAALEIALQNGHDSARLQGMLAQHLLLLGDTEAAAGALAKGEAIVAQEFAAGRQQYAGSFVVEFARQTFSLVTADLETLLAMAIGYTAAVDDDPDAQGAPIYRAGMTNIMLGRYEDAVRMLDYLIENGALDFENYALAAYAHKKAGDAEKAAQYLTAGRTEVAEFLAERHLDPRTVLRVALLQAADDQRNAAIETLQDAYKDFGYRDHIYLTYMPIFDALRDDPRFIDLLQQMRADCRQMRLRVDQARRSGDWMALIARHFEAETF